MRIALYLNNLDEEYQLALYKSVSIRAKELGMDILCIQQERLDNGWKSLQEFPSHNYISVDGVLLLTSVLIERASSSSVDQIKKIYGNIPVISIGRQIKKLPSLIVKTKNSMESLMDHLLNVHHYEHFLFLGGPANHEDNIEREKVFSNSIMKAHENNPAVSGVVLHAGFNEYFGMTAIEQYIEQHQDDPVDVIVSANDTMAEGALRALKTSHDEYWARCAVTGFDDIPRARLESPPLTTIRQPTKQIGCLAVETMYKLITNQKVPDIIKVDTALIIRNSCGCTGESKLDNRSIGTEYELQDYIASIQREQIRTEQIQQHGSYFSQQLNALTSMDNITDGLRTFLGNIGVQFFYFILFNKDKAEFSDKALLIFQKNNGTENVYNPPLPISLKSFFSTDIYSSHVNSSSLIMHYITSGSNLLGMIIYDSDNTIHPQMCSISIILGYTINRLRFLDQEKTRSQELEKEIDKRTKEIILANEELEKESQRRIKVEAEVLKISEQERMRFSMDLHDDICQRLAGISMMCKGMSSIQPDLQELSTLIDETLHRTRQYAHDSFPMELESLGLNEAIGNLCNTVQIQGNNNTIINYIWKAKEPLSLDSPQRINIYRIIQEALHNTMKHAHAKKITVSIIQNKKTLTVTIQDDGRGNPIINKDSGTTDIPTKTKNGSIKSVGIGLRSMYYRADQIGAKCSIKSSISKGTVVKLIITL